jgi:hypothetical protein
MLTQHSSTYPYSGFGIANNGGGLGGVDFNALIVLITVRQLPEQVIDTLIDACTLFLPAHTSPNHENRLPSPSSLTITSTMPPSK